MRVALFGKGGFKFLIHPNRLSISASDKSDKENYPFIIDVKEVNLPPGEKHHIDLLVKGHQIIALFDGEPVLAAEDPKVNDQGKRYQFSMSSGCSFDNFQLSEIKLNEEAFAQVEFKKGKHSRK